MKKKLSIYYGILVATIIIPIVIMLITSIGIINKNVNSIEESDFIAKAEILNTKVSQMKIVIHGENSSVSDFIQSHIKKSLQAKNDNLDLKFIKCTDIKTANLFYFNEYNNLVGKIQQASKDSNDENVSKETYNGKNFNFQKVNTNFGNYAFLRVEDTYLSIISSDDYAFNQALDLFGFSGLKLDFKNVFIKSYSTSWLFIIFILIYATIPMAYLFKKANIHPLIAFVPFCNKYFLCRMADNEGWKMVFFYIPVVSIVYKIIISLKLAKVFNKSELFGVGIFFAPVILLPIIAFDGSEYNGDFSEAKKNKNTYEEILKEEGVI